jgi:hypothetical protein
MVCLFLPSVTWTDDKKPSFLRKLLVDLDRHFPMALLHMFSSLSRLQCLSEQLDLLLLHAWQKLALECTLETQSSTMGYQKWLLFHSVWKSEIHGILWSSMFTCSDENGRKRTEKPHFYFRFYIFWRKRDRVRKMRVRKRNRNMRVYGNEPIRSEIQRKRSEVGA